MANGRSFVFVVALLVSAAVAQTNVEQRIETVFGAANGTRANTTRSSLFGPGFHEIVQPDPIIVPTTAPQVMATSGGENCTCVPYYMCDPNTRARTDETNSVFGAIDIRFNANDCQDVLDVCCVESQRLEPSTVSTTTVAPIAPRTCGIRNVGGLDFSLAGNTNEAGFGEFPWTVALIRIADDACLCGGSLIHPQVILTANHCVRGLAANTLKIRAGEWDTQTTKERLPYQERTVAQIISHHRYNSKTLANDVALLLLDSPVALDQHINTICLPAQDQVSTGRTCVASGWGKDVFGKEGKYSVIMKRVEMPVVDSGVCQQILQSSRLGPRFRLDPSFICAGGEPGKDTCKGDGGSPLVCPTTRGNRYMQTGIVSWGIGCQDERPGVYANVASFRNWIDDQMITLGFGTSSYSSR